MILNSPLIPKWAAALRKDAIIHSAHSSTSIEGNKLSLNQVSKLAHGESVVASRKDKKEVLNYIDVLEHLERFLADGRITVDNILRIHKELTKGTLENRSDEGVLRNRYVVVGNRFTGKVNFYPPENEKVRGLMQEYADWLNSKQAKELEPVLHAGIAHYELVRIHPFVDGNGRTARVIAALVLYFRAFDTKQFFSLDDYYDFNRKAYYAALQTVDRDVRDLTHWLEYFVEGVASSMEAVKEQVIRLSSERLRRAKKGQIALTEKQMRIVEFVNRNGGISAAEVAGMFNFSRQAALKELRKLVKQHVLKPSGKAKATRYLLD